MGLSFRTQDNSRQQIPFAKPALKWFCWHLLTSSHRKKELKTVKFSQRIQCKPLLLSKYCQLYNEILPPEVHKSPRIYCQQEAKTKLLLMLEPRGQEKNNYESHWLENMRGTLCFLTMQSSCMKHQEVVTFAYS